jgi:hypothetical protein
MLSCDITIGRCFVLTDRIWDLMWCVENINLLLDTCVVYIVCMKWNGSIGPFLSHQIQCFPIVLFFIYLLLALYKSAALWTYIYGADFRLFPCYLSRRLWNGILVDFYIGACYVRPMHRWSELLFCVHDQWRIQCKTKSYIL